MKTLLILGNDKIASSAFNLNILKNKNIIIAIDYSSNYKRVISIVFKKRISFFLLIKMFFSELFRKSIKTNLNLNRIDSNKDIIDLIQKFNPKRVVLFRAGLIISKKVISLNVPIMNIHCAKVPEYGGIGSIQRALKDKHFIQQATLHQVTTTIDKGEVFDTNPYELNPNKSYFFNENIAYKSGLVLLKRTLEK